MDIKKYAKADEARQELVKIVSSEQFEKDFWTLLNKVYKDIDKIEDSELIEGNKQVYTLGFSAGYLKGRDL